MYITKSGKLHPQTLKSALLDTTTLSLLLKKLDHQPFTRLRFTPNMRAFSQPFNDSDQHLAEAPGFRYLRSHTAKKTP
jgi:hypothetical protein